MPPSLLTFFLVIAILLTFCVVTLFVLASLVTMLSSFDEAYDDLHSEKEYLENHKAKRK